MKILANILTVVLIVVCPYQINDWRLWAFGIALTIIRIGSKE
jgi:hypothetical protein